MTLDMPVERIDGVWQFERSPRGYSSCRSTPGHLLHLILEGEYDLRTDGRTYRVKKGDVIYYHGAEFVEWLGNRCPVTFISVSLTAAQLKPLPLDLRVFQAHDTMKNHFIELYQASLNRNILHYKLNMFSALCSILGQITEFTERESAFSEDIWHNIERLIRENRLFRPTLDELSELVGKSRATVVRACRKTTGESPMTWLRKYRMNEARGLLQYSDSNVTQVADYLGYPRMHEFSREFSKYFGYPPTQIKKKI